MSNEEKNIEPSLVARRSSLIAEAKQWVEQECVWDDQLLGSDRSLGLTPTVKPQKSLGSGLPGRQAGPTIGQTPATSAKSFALQALYQKYKDCTRCSLGNSRIKFVFGVGSADAKVLFIGEGPGYQEDRQGEPFVGPAGQLLDKIMASIGLSRKTNAYIANIVKCHPMIHPETLDARGNDRPPSPLEVETCSPILKAQIAIIQPRVIVPLGSPSAKAMLMATEGISKLRGKLYPFPKAYYASAGGEMWSDLSFLDTIQILPTYHPAALLRNPDLKKDVWEDMKLLRDLLAKL